MSRKINICGFSIWIQVFLKKLVFYHIQKDMNGLPIIIPWICHLKQIQSILQTLTLLFSPL